MNPGIRNHLSKGWDLLPLMAYKLARFGPAYWAQILECQHE